jgi:hypothetical protein
MTIISACELPQTSFLLALRDEGAYTDCYCVDIARKITHVEFVETFYTTWLFKLERSLIRVFASKHSTDREANELARSEREDFAVWRVERRGREQILLADQSGRTRSWLMVVPNMDANGAEVTRLYFGSALIPGTDRKTGKKRFGALFTSLLGFHHVYSRALLRAAVSRLSRSGTRS